MTQRLSNLIKILAVNLIIFIVAIILLEILFRIFPIVNITWVDGNYETGFTIPANYQERTEHPEHDRGYFVYRSNNLGCREDENTSFVKKDSVRIVVLGDSHTDGVCWNRESYANQLEKYLNHSDSRITYDVINAGTGKYSPFQYLRAYQYRLKPLRPEVVIIGFYIGNDFFDMYRRDDRPSCYFDKDGRIVEIPPDFYFYASPDFKESWKAHSYIYYLMFGSRFWKSLSYTVTRAFIFYRNMSGMVNTSSVQILRFFRDLYHLSDLNRAATTQSLAQKAFFHYFPDRQTESVKLVQYVLTQFGKEQAIQPFKLLVVPIPTKFQIEFEKLQDVRYQISAKFPYLGHHEPADTEDELTDSLIAVMQDMDIDYIDLRDILKKESGGKKLYFDFDFHINPQAHMIIGREIAKYLVRETELHGVH